MREMTAEKQRLGDEVHRIRALLRTALELMDEEPAREEPAQSETPATENPAAVPTAPRAVEVDGDQGIRRVAG